MPGFGVDGRNIAIVTGSKADATSVTIPERITMEGERYYVDRIGWHAFASQDKLKTVTFNSRCTPSKIEDLAFYRTGISSISIPSSVETIGKEAFVGTSISQIEIPSSVKSIGDSAFYETKYLKTVVLHEGLKKIGGHTFDNSEYYGQNSEIYMPSTLESIGEDAFKYFYPIKVDIPDLKAWCGVLFGNESANPIHKAQEVYINGECVENLVIPDGITHIHEYAFSGLKVKSVTIPASVVQIGKGAFYRSSKDLIIEYGYEPIDVEYGAFDALTTLKCDRPLDGFKLDASQLNSLVIGNHIKTIPLGMFKGSLLQEVVLPPSIETIGALAFSESLHLESIVMGSNVKSIGAKAFYNAPASKVSITAQTPPAAVNDTFSNYTGKLYVQGENAMNAYIDSDYCWYQFECFELSEPTELKIDCDKQIYGKPGDTFQLRASLNPSDVSLPQVFWSSTDPAIATVDYKGLVTLRDGRSTTLAKNEDNANSYSSCKIVAESLYANIATAEVVINVEQSGIENVICGSHVNDEIDYSLPVKVYNLQGAFVSNTVDGLTSGIYIVSQGRNVKKIVLR